MNRIHLQAVRFPDDLWCIALNSTEINLFVVGIYGMIHKARVKIETRKQAIEGEKTLD